MLLDEDTSVQSRIIASDVDLYPNQSMMLGCPRG